MGMTKLLKVAKRNESLRAYFRKYPNMSYAALGRIFKISRQRVWQILGKIADAEYLKEGISQEAIAENKEDLWKHQNAGAPDALDR